MILGVFQLHLRGTAMYLQIQVSAPSAGGTGSIPGWGKIPHAIWPKKV